MSNNAHWDSAQGIRYDMPKNSEYSAPLVPWQVSVQRSVLLIHDMQRYFLERFDLIRQPAIDLINNIEQAMKMARRLRIPIVYTAQPGSMTPEQRGLLKDFWGPGMAASPEHRMIIGRLAPQPDDLVLEKWRYSAFARTSLDDFIRGKGRDQLIICGIYAHVGVLVTAIDYYMRDLETFVLADAVADFDRIQHLRALDYAARTSARVLPTGAALEELGLSYG